MNPIDPSKAVDFNSFANQLVLSRVFQDMLKKPESDDEADPGTVALNEINRPLAAAMARAATGFGD